MPATSPSAPSPGSGSARSPGLGVPRMDRLVQEIMKDVFDAYVDRDVAKAVAARQRDRGTGRALHQPVPRGPHLHDGRPRNITPCTHLLFIAKNLERIGDHATNIAETIHFLVVGQPLTTARPKGDTSSQMVVNPTDAESQAAAEATL